MRGVPRRMACRTSGFARLATRAETFREVGVPQEVCAARRAVRAPRMQRGSAVAASASSGGGAAAATPAAER